MTKNITIIEKEEVVKKKDLTLQQQLFIKLYTEKGDTTNNGTLSYALAYNYELEKDSKGKNITTGKDYCICKANASRLLANANIKSEIKDIWLSRFIDSDVDARTSQILHNGKDSDSIQAIKIHNELKNRITKRIDLTSNGRPMINMSDDDLKELAEG